MSSAALAVVPSDLAGCPQDDVLTGLPHDGVVVREDTQVVRCLPALQVEVVDVRGVSGSPRARSHARPRTAPLVPVLGRADPVTSSIGEDEHVATDVLLDRVGERLGRHRWSMVAVAGGEPDLDLVAGLGTDGGAELAVVVVNACPRSARRLATP